MIPCECGHKMYRNGRGVLKVSGEEWRRFLCHKCRRSLTFYRHEGSDWTLDKRNSGEWSHDDSEFMAALERSRDAQRAVDRGESRGDGQDALPAHA